MKLIVLLLLAMKLQNFTGGYNYIEVLMEQKRQDILIVLHIPGQYIYSNLLFCVTLEWYLFHIKFLIKHLHIRIQNECNRLGLTLCPA